MELILKRIGFYILSFTWGFIMSFAGLLVMMVLACFGKVHTFHGRLYATVGKSWGGLSLGCFFLCGENDQFDYLRAHEAGHGIQNILWGPLMLFVIVIPSATRYWYRELKYNRKGLLPPHEYDAIWFEHQASAWGRKYILKDRI